MVSRLEVEKFNKKFRWNFSWTLGFVILLEIILFSILVCMTTPFLIPLFSVVVLTTKYWYYLLAVGVFYCCKAMKRGFKKINDRIAISKVRSKHRNN